MTTPSTPADTAWGRLADSPPAAREAQMLDRYGALASLPREEHEGQMLAMVRAEYELPNDKLRDFTLSRLRVWLRLPEPAAREVSSSYLAAMKHLPGAMAMRRVTLVQTLAAEFSEDDEARLHALDPSAFGGRPSRRDLARLQAAKDAKDAEGAERRAAKKKGWWPFGKR
jgi:hypothetical protein